MSSGARPLEADVRGGGKSRLASHVAPLSAEGLLVLACFVDGVAAASGVSVMVLQGKEVAFPSALHLLVFQLCYIVPQLFTTVLAERLTTRFSARKVLLPATLLSSLLAMYVLLQSLSTRSLSLFFLSRVINGFLRHPKVLFPAACATQGPRASEALADMASLTFPAMHAGYMLSAILGDIWQDAVVVQRQFVYAELCAVILTCALGVFSNGARQQQPQELLSKGAKETSAVMPCWRALHAMISALPSPSSREACGVLAVFVAFRVAVSLNQCMYPVVGPSTFQLPYVLTAVHLIGQDWLVPRVAGALETSGARKAVLLGSPALLIVGTWAAPVALSLGPHIYYPVTLLLVDIPTVVVDKILSSVVEHRTGWPVPIRSGFKSLQRYVVIGAKLLCPPLRIALVALLPRWKYAAQIVAVPAAVYAAVFAYTRKQAISVAATCICVTLLTTMKA